MFIRYLNLYLRRFCQYIASLLLMMGLAIQMGFAFLPVQHWQTPEGAKVYFIHVPHIPMLDLKISVNAGKFYEKTQYGLADLTADLLTQGAGDLDEEAYISALEVLGTEMFVSAGYDTSVLSMRSLTDPELLTASLGLLEKALTSPHFSAAVLEREIERSLLALKSIQDNPAALAREALFAHLYPETRLAVSSQALAQALPSLTTEALKKFFQEYYHAQDAVIVLVGDVSQEKARQISGRISQWLGKGEGQRQSYTFKVRDIAESINIPFDAPQSQIMLGHVGIDRQHPDYLALMIGNHLLGGSGLTSILSQEIREKRGLTYHISSGFNAGRFAGPFVMQLATKNNSVDEAIEVTRQLLQDFLDKVPDETALNLVKNNLIGSFSIDLSTNDALADALLMMGLYALPLDYFETYREQVRGVTALQIQQAFQRNVFPDKLIQVIVGEPSITEPQPKLNTVNEIK